MSSDKEQARDEIEENVNDEPPVQEPVQEAVIETTVEEEAKAKTKPKAKAKAKPKIKITKQPVEPVEPEPVIEVEVEEQPNTYNNKQMANCPDCNLTMTQHTLKHIHKQDDIVKEHFKKKSKKKLNKKWQKSHLDYRSRPTKTITHITDDIVNTYIQENPDIVTHYLRNERVMKAQRKHMNAISLLSNAFKLFNLCHFIMYIYIYIYIKHGK